MAVVAAVHLADVQVGALLRDALGHDADDDFVDAGGKVDELLDLKAAAKEFGFQLLCGDVDVDVLFQPTERYFHGRLPPLNL